VNWRGAGDPHNLLGGDVIFRVRTIRIAPSGWSVSGAVVNRTKEPLQIVYGHESAGHNGFGIRIDEAAAHALRSRPEIPNLLRPGEGWTGTFAGPDGLARGTLVHVQFGQFATSQGYRFTWVTDRAYRVR